MDSTLSYFASQLATSLADRHAVKACAAFRSESRLRGNKAASDLLASLALNSCMQSLRSEEMDHYGSTERSARRWLNITSIYELALDVAFVVKGFAPNSLALNPAMCLESIQGISSLGRNLSCEEQNEISNTLICFASIAYCCRSRGAPLDLPSHGELLHEWLRPKNGTVELSPWLESQLRFNGADALHSFFTAPQSHYFGQQKIRTGPWDLKQELSSILEGVEIDRASLEVPKSKAPSL